ncbi:hypothetical protein SLEP1_g16536 [Rubroshorea leprosula]|uniref:Fe2OG dioxygenase domain-containing protein n=1 Tax=Rubroshorea leprosula TaxID=152421 RepID=A0AAV5J0A0_9ROSI|nr:hypothetical protein SLEP1_g16536 [Rubroshorea leprosula]
MLPPSSCRTIRPYLCRFSSNACYSREIPVRYCSSNSKMGPGKNAVPNPSGSCSRPSISERSHESQKNNQMYIKKQPTAHDRQTTAFGEKGFSKNGGDEQAMQSLASRGIQSVQSESSNVQNCDYEAEYPPLSVNMGCSSKGMNLGRRKSEIDLGSKRRKEGTGSPELAGLKIGNIGSPCEEISLPMQFGKKAMNSGRRKTRIDLGSEQKKGDIRSPELEGLNISNIASPCDELSLPTKFGKRATHREKSPSGRSQSRNLASTKSSNCSDESVKVDRFYICNHRIREFDGHNDSINESNWQNRMEMDATLEGNEHRVLRSGMVLLKHYIALPDQIKIVETCHNLGKGPGGFYRPGYKDGAKLHLHMMCLGLNWDPQTRKYSKEHPVDCCEPPDIPNHFSLLVQGALQEAHALIKKDLRGSNVEDTLPTMSPDICIVNFYMNSGRLGLHQDRDESRESIYKGLPVVSFSIGHSAEFLYGIDRNVDKAEKVLLESGDVLIFGGESRLVFHGVPSIVPDTAPKALLAETGMHPGRLNLTFRKF